jgi:hypothetical protein
VVLIVDHFPADGIYIEVHVCRTHKNGNLYTAVVKIFFIRNFFDYHHLAVGRANNIILMNGFLPGGNAEKGYDKKQEGQAEDKDYPVQQGLVKADKIKGDQVDHGKYDGAEGNGFISFFMDGHGSKAGPVK